MEDSTSAVPPEVPKNSAEPPEFLKAFIASATPPEGYGNANFVLNWTILLMFAPYIFYLLEYTSLPYKDWFLLAYSWIMILLYSAAISGFKREMVYVSNPFDFVKVNFITLVNIVIYFGMSYYYLSHFQKASFTSPITVFDAIYFSFVTIATVGYGDISPLSWLARLNVIFEICFGLWFFVTVIPVAVADQAERAKNFRLQRAKMAVALKKAFEDGELKVTSIRDEKSKNRSFFKKSKPEETK